VCGYLAALPASLHGKLPQVLWHEHEQRRAARAAASSAAGLLPQAAGDGKTVRSAVRGDGSRVHLLSVFDVATGTVHAQREVGRTGTCGSWGAWGFPEMARLTGRCCDLSSIPEVLLVTPRQPGAGPGRGGIQHLIG
jgi:hypothetical protein